MTTETFEGTDGLTIGTLDNGTFDFIAISGDPTIGAGVPATDYTLAIDVQTGNVWTKLPGVDTVWQGGSLPGLSGGSSSSLPIALDSGGSCNVSVTLGQLPVTLNSGGTCLVNTT